MTSFLKRLLKGRQSKHRKLLEDWTTAEKENEELEVVASGSGTARSGPSGSGTSRPGPSESGASGTGASRSGASGSGVTRSGSSRNSKSGTPRFGASRFGTSRFGNSRSGASRPGSSGSLQEEVREEDDSNFYVKYLGSTLVSTPNGHLATADAIRAVIAMTKLSRKKLRRVTVNINLKGIRVTDTETNAVQFDISIYRISYCSADATYNHVFAFIATNSNETMECHAFLCRRRKLVSKRMDSGGGNQASELRRGSTPESLSNEDQPLEHTNPVAAANKPDSRKKTEKGRLGYKTKKCITGAGKKKQFESAKPLIDFSADIDDVLKKGKSWVQFDEDDEVNPKIPNKPSVAENLKEFDPLEEKCDGTEQGGPP